MQALVAKDITSANPQRIVLPVVLHTLAGPQGDTVVLDTQKDMICIGHAHYLDPDLLAAFVRFLILRRHHHQEEVICPRKAHDVVGAEVLVIAVMTTAVIVTEVEVGAGAEVVISGTEEIVHFFGGRAVISIHIIYLPV